MRPTDLTLAQARAALDRRALSARQLSPVEPPPAMGSMPPPAIGRTPVVSTSDSCSIQPRMALISAARAGSAASSTWMRLSVATRFMVVMSTLIAGP